MARLVLRKPLDIFLFSFLAHKTRTAMLASGTTYQQLLGIGLLCGTCFTMSIFIATLAFDQMHLRTIAKMAVMTGSALSASTGLYFLRKILTPSKGDETEKQKTRSGRERLLPQI